MQTIYNHLTVIVKPMNVGLKENLFDLNQRYYSKRYGVMLEY